MHDEHGPSEEDHQSGYVHGRVGRRSLLAGLAGVGAGFIAATNTFGEPARPHVDRADAASQDATPQSEHPQAQPSQQVLAITPVAAAPHITINAADYGAVGDNRTDSTKAIQAALHAAPVKRRGASGNDVPARTVTLPAGSFVISSTLKLPPNCTLEGSGAGATSLSARGKFDAIRLATSSNVQCGVRNLAVVCSGGGGINFSNQNYGPSMLGDTRHVIENVVVVEPAAAFYGIAFAGTECRINNITIQRPAGTALHVGGSDHMLQEITIGGGTSRGNVLVVDSSNCRIVDLKVFGSRGRLAIGGLRNTVLGLEVQDTGGSRTAGVVALGGSHSGIYGLMIDSCESSSGGVLNIGGSHNVAAGTIVANRGGAQYTSSYALETATGAGHQLDLQLIGPFRKRAVVSSHGLLGNAVTLNAMGASHSASGGSGTLTPSPFDSTTYVMNGITGSLAVANPRSSLSHAGSADFWAGMTLCFALQASGQHALSFGSAYTLAARAPALSGRVMISFLYDGTTWREMYRSRS